MHTMRWHPLAAPENKLHSYLLEWGLCRAEANGDVPCCAFVRRREFIVRELKRIDCVSAGACCVCLCQARVRENAFCAGAVRSAGSRREYRLHQQCNLFTYCLAQ